MGELSRWELGRDRLPSTAVIFGGQTPESSIARITGRFDRVVFHKHDNFEPFLVESEDGETLLAFQVYGAPLIADLLYVLRDGGTTSAVFLGAAFGLHPQLRVGDGGSAERGPARC